MDTLKRVGLTREQVAQQMGVKLQPLSLPTKATPIKKPDSTAMLVLRLHNKGMTNNEVARQLKITKKTVERLLNEF